MVDRKKIYLEFARLPGNEQVEVLGYAREDAYRSEGKRKVVLKWLTGQACVLIICSFFGGFGLASAYHVLTSSRPDNNTYLIVGALVAVAVVGFWPSIQRRVEIWLFAKHISNWLPEYKI